MRLSLLVILKRWKDECAYNTHLNFFHVLSIMGGKRSYHDLKFRKSLTTSFLDREKKNAVKKKKKKNQEKMTVFLAEILT